MSKLLRSVFCYCYTNYSIGFNPGFFDLPAAFDVSTDWIKCNVNETAYYRVNYDRQNWERIAVALKLNPQVVFRIRPYLTAVEPV